MPFEPGLNSQIPGSRVVKGSEVVAKMGVTDKKDFVAACPLGRAWYTTVVAAAFE